MTTMLLETIVPGSLGPKFGTPLKEKEATASSAEAKEFNVYAAATVD